MAWNLVFRLEGEHRFLHERPAAQPHIERLMAEKKQGKPAICLVTGRHAAPVQLHPKIKGVQGTAAAEVPLVSFNISAAESYGKEQGENAPTSEAAAFRYGAALNRLLDRGSPNRLARPLGDATVVFWADASDAGEEAAQAAEDFFAAAFSPAAPDPGRLGQDAQEAAKLRDALDHVAKGRPVRELDPRLGPGVRFHVLGLSPNAARLSVRFWLTDSFETFARRLAAHYAALAVEPLPFRWGTPGPSVARLLVETTALQRKFENIPPLLAGEVTRAILSGTPYPRTLLTAAMMRLRAGDDPGTGWHAAVLRAVLARNPDRQEVPPVSLEREHPNPAYQLGRMFAMAEIAQRMALGKVNATIRDRYFGAASATPASVFPLLLRGMQHHIAKLRKEGKGGFIEREMDQIAAQLPPELPRSLRLEEQGRFVIGYYHQRRARFGDVQLDDAADQDPPEGDETHD